MNPFLIEDNNDDEVTVGSKYQAVIAKKARRVASKIKPGVKVIVTPLDKWSVNIRVKPKPQDWAKNTLGMSQGLWQGDATKLVRRMRDEEWK